jgi:hypothetical protein
MLIPGTNIVSPIQREYPAFEKILLQGHQITANIPRITINSGNPKLRISMDVNTSDKGLMLAWAGQLFFSISFAGA